jgi:hypothetical protein
MKVRTGLLMLAVTTGVLWAQSPTAATSQAKHASAASAAASTGTPQAGTSAKPATAAKSTATKSSSKTTSKKKTTKKAAPDAKTGNTATNVASAPKHVGPSRRDPFVSPVQARANGPINCGTGKRCLVLDETILQGIVKAPNGMIAVVSNSANKAYFLRENDPVYNGFVMRITPDTVVFREQVTDRMGKTFTREVVKKVNAPAV